MIGYRKTPLITPSWGEEIIITKPRCNCVFVCISPGPTHIFHTPMARYSLYVLKVPLHTKQTNKANTELLSGKRTLMDWPCFETTDFGMKLLKAEWEVNQQEGGEGFKCYMIWQMMVAVLHWKGQQRTERGGNTEKYFFRNLQYSKLLMMIRWFWHSCWENL